MKKFFAVAFILFLSHLSAQTAYKYKGEFAGEQQKEVLKSVDSLFYFMSDITLNVSTYHINPYKDIPADQTFKPGYLDEQLKLLKKNPDEALIYNNIARYYQNNGDKEKAQEYFTKALANLKVRPKAKDSASYYSQRAIIKFNLGQEGIADMEKALSINKADSLSLVFYPFLLVNKQEFPKARAIVVDALNDEDNKIKEFSYVMLGIIDVFNVAMALGDLNDERMEQIQKTDIKKIIDLDANDRYMDPKNPWYNKAKQMMGIFNGIVKYSKGLQPGETFTPSNDDIAYMDEKEQFFKNLLKEKNTNAYGAYFSLGILSYMQKEFPEAIAYFEKALLAFPKDKEGFQFNTMEIYDNMAGVYYMMKDYDKVREVLAKKISLKSIANTDRKEAYLDLAGLDLMEGKLAEAETQAMKALEIEDSFGANCLLSYVSFKRNYGHSADKYLQKAMAQISSEQEVCRILTMVAAIQVHNGSPDGAHAAYNEYRSYLGTYECDCEELLARYIAPNN